MHASPLISAYPQLRGDLVEPDVSIEAIDDDRLEERVSTEPENADLFGDGSPDSERLPWLIRSTFGLDSIIYGTPKGKRSIVLSLGRRIVAVAGVELNPRDSQLLAVTHISVEPMHRGKGYGRAVVEAVYAYAVKHGKSVVPSTFTEMGLERLAKIFAQLDLRFPAAARVKNE